MSEEDKADLFVFLDGHPELKKEFDAFDPVGLESETVRFPEPESLKRGRVTLANHEWYFAAYAEGDLTDSERKAVEEFAIGDVDMMRQLRLMQRVFLDAENATTYPAKAALKQQVIAASERTPISSAGTSSADAGISSADTGTSSAETGTSSADAGTSVAGSTLAVVDAGMSLAGREAAGSTAAGSTAVGASSPVGRSLVARRLWYYMSAAAVVLLMAGLFFLRHPDSMVSNLAYDMPAAKEVGDPEAVAEAPSLPGRYDQQAASLAEADARITVPVSDATALPSFPVQQTESASDHNTIPLQAIGLLAFELSPMSAINVSQAVQMSGQEGGGRRSVSLEHKTEFAYWSQDLLPSALYTDEEYALLPTSGSGETGLTQLAINSLQKTLPVDFSKVDDHLSQSRIPLRELAVMGLSELGVMATNALGLERETDADGRTLAVRAGELFEARRSKR